MTRAIDQFNKRINKLVKDHPIGTIRFRLVADTSDQRIPTANDARPLAESIVDTHHREDLGRAIADQTGGATVNVARQFINRFRGRTVGEFSGRQTTTLNAFLKSLQAINRG